MEQEQQTQTGTNSSAAPTATSEKVEATTDNSTLMGILCYLGILLIIPYLMAKDNAFVKFHLQQGLVLVAIEVIVYVLGMTSFFYGFWALLSLVNLGVIVLSIIGIVNVVQKKQVALPLTGLLADKIKL